MKNDEESSGELANDPMSAGRLLAALPKFIAVLSFLSLFLSIIHEYAFFAFVGRAWLTLQTTGDYLREAINWIPETFGIVFVYTMVGLLFARRLRFMRPPVQSVVGAFERKKNFLFAYSEKQRIFLLASFSFICIFYFFSSPFFRQIILGFILVISWLAICMEILIRHTASISKYMGIAFLISAVALPAAMIIAWFSGSSSALAALGAEERSYKVTVADNVVYEGSILRQLERGILIYHDGVVLFLTWDQVKSVEQTQGQIKGKPYACIAVPIAKLCDGAL